MVAGGKWLYENITGALGVGGGGPRHKRSKDKYSKVLDETGWLGPSEEYLEEMGLMQEDAAADAGQSGMGPGCAAGPEAATAGPYSQQQQPDSPFTVAAGISGANPGQQRQYTAWYDPAAAVPVRAVPRRPPSEGDIDSWGSDTDPDEYQSASSRTSRTSSTGTAGMNRLASQSAPLPAVYMNDTPAAASGLPAPSRSSAAEGKQDGQPDELDDEQQQEDEKKEALKAAQEHIAGKDAKDLGGTQVKLWPRLVSQAGYWKLLFCSLQVAVRCIVMHVFLLGGRVA